jgi:NAD(P)-dependent dehydrogenase (short-subunit alcohol dehydrogenase family)
MRSRTRAVVSVLSSRTHRAAAPPAAGRHARGDAHPPALPHPCAPSVPRHRRGIYANAKLANLLFTLELKKRLAAHAPGVLAVSCHPGYTATGLQTTPGKGPTWLMGCMNSLFAQDVRVGAQPQLYAALGDDIDNGDYTGPVGKTKGAATKAPRAARACDEAAAARLWELSVQLTACDYLNEKA